MGGGQAAWERLREPRLAEAACLWGAWPGPSSAPHTVCPTQHPGAQRAEAFVRAFLKRSTPRMSPQAREDQLQRKAVVLEFFPRRKQKEKKKSRGLSARQRRELKLFDIKPEQQRYPPSCPLPFCPSVLLPICPSVLLPVCPLPFCPSALCPSALLPFCPGRLSAPGLWLGRLARFCHQGAAFLYQLGLALGLAFSKRLVSCPGFCPSPSGACSESVARGNRLFVFQLF